MRRVTAEELFPQGSEAGRKRQHQLEYHEFFTPGMYIWSVMIQRWEEVNRIQKQLILEEKRQSRQPSYPVEQKNVLNSPQLWESCLKLQRCLRSPKLFDFKFNRRPLSTTTARNPPACDIFFNENYSYPHIIRINYAEIPPLFWWDRSPAICQKWDHF